MFIEISSSISFLFTLILEYSKISISDESLDFAYCSSFPSFKSTPTISFCCIPSFNSTPPSCSNVPLFQLHYSLEY